MRKLKRSMVCGATALGMGLATALVAAPPASASSGNYISFSNKGWFLVDTCYKWKSSTTSDTCDYAKPISTDWRVEIPEDAKGVRIEVTVAGNVSGRNVSPQITDLSRNHCYELTGTTFNPTITETCY